MNTLGDGCPQRIVGVYPQPHFTLGAIRNWRVLSNQELGEPPKQRQARVLFVGHRKEILEQAIGTFRAVLRIPDFGELLVGPYVAARYDHPFALWTPACLKV